MIYCLPFTLQCSNVEECYEKLKEGDYSEMSLHDRTSSLNMTQSLTNASGISPGPSTLKRHPTYGPGFISTSPNHRTTEQLRSQIHSKSEEQVDTNDTYLQRGLSMISSQQPEPGFAPHSPRDVVPEMPSFSDSPTLRRRLLSTAGIYRLLSSVCLFVCFSIKEVK